jgi:hypothetical protein
MREYVRRRVAPRHQLAVVPDEPVTIRHRHPATPRLAKRLF